jgi:hypothetical protein
MTNTTLLRNPFLKLTAILTIIFILLNLPLMAWGNPVPGRWEKVTQTKPGDTITVYTKDGGKRRYNYVFMDESFLHCANNYSNDITIELGTIDKIVVFKAGKYAKHGALWGAAGGAGVMTGLGLAYGDITKLGAVMLGGVGAVLGAGVGFLTGAAVGAPGETVYISKEEALRKAK